MAKTKKSCSQNITYYKSLKDRLKSIYFNDLFNMICNTIIIKNKPEHVPERWIKEKLLLNGEIDIYNGEWLEYTGNNGYFVYGEPTAIFLRTANNLNIFQVSSKLVNRIGANQKRTSPMDFLNMQIDKLVELEISFFQNLKASRSGNILEISDDDVYLSILQTIQSNIDGTPVMVTNGNAMNSDVIKQYTIKTDFIADRLNQLKTEIYNETLLHYGILNNNNSKRERIQVGEIEAQSDYAYDSIYTIIDTANRDLKNAGVETRLVFNGAMDDFTPNRDLNDENNEMGETEND